MCYTVKRVPQGAEQRDLQKKERLEMKGEKCVLYERDCVGCGECDRCDLDPTKICDSCGKCIESDKNYKIIKIDKIISE